MKKLLVIGIAFLMGLCPLTVQAHGDDEDSDQMITGEVVDVTCYLSHPATGLGDGHAKCAQSCINKGLPVAIRKGNTLYIASGTNHKPANQMLAKYAGKNVTVTGHIMERDGVKMITVEHVEMAK